MGFMDKVKEFVGIGDEYYEEEVEVSQNDIDAYKREVIKSKAEPAPENEQKTPAPITHIEEPLKTGISARSYPSFDSMMSAATSSASNAPQSGAESRNSINSSDPFRIIIIEPKSMDECKKLIENLRQRKPVVVNLERVDAELAHKIFHYLSGATYALEGKAQYITPNIFMFAPNNVNITEEIQRITAASKPANSNPWK